MVSNFFSFFVFLSRHSENRGTAHTMALPSSQYYLTSLNASVAQWNEDQNWVAARQPGFTEVILHDRFIEYEVIFFAGWD